MGKHDTITKIRESGEVAESNKSLNKYMNQLNKIQKKGRVDSNTIKVQEFTDHKNISLWTLDGKRIGPMHRDNCEEAFKRFWNLGVELTTDQPTAEEIEAYKKTPEYKERAKKQAEVRARKSKSKKKGEIDRITQEIAKMTGQTVEAINNIVSPDNVKKVSDVTNA